MKVKTSPYLKSIKPGLQYLVNELCDQFDYASVLATDSVGKAFSVRTRSMDIRDFMGERGFVFRVIHQGRVAEISTNNIDVSAGQTRIELIQEFKQLLAHQARFSSALVDPSTEDDTQIEDNKEYGKPFDSIRSEEKLKQLKDIVETVGSKDERIVNVMVQFVEVTVAKLFLSKKKDLMQTYPWSTGYIVIVAKGDKGVKMGFNSVSGMKGVELMDDLRAEIKTSLKNIDDTLKCETIEPGEYDVICTPDITGLIAHEAFGHGVEMDMFVKNRAKAVEYIDKPVASSLVNMHDGALGPLNVSSYAFDDEGTLAQDTRVIEEGILKRGISDALSAMRLHTPASGNGKRESFERKAYTRMTTTYFTSGKNTVEEMISSIKKGYLLDGMESGMEDPKNWGIQCVLSRAYEIVDGKLSGKVVGPVILTGYVVDLLKSINMVSTDFEIMGSGFCGKGHKEWVKTAGGGAYIKAKARLG